jgi:hypothetical protein
MEERLAYLTGLLSDAIEDFEKALKIDDATLDPIVADTVRSGRAQKFEFTVELFWKTAKRFLELHGEILSYAGFFNKAAAGLRGKE